MGKLKPKSPDTSAADAARQRQEDAQARREADLAKEENDQKQIAASSERAAKSRRAGRAQTLFDNSGVLGVSDKLGGN